MGVLLALLLVAAQVQGVPRDVQVSPDVPSPAAAFAGRTIEHVDVVVDGEPTTDPTILMFVETRPGTPLSMASVRETIAHLYGLGRYQEITVEALDAGPGIVVLRYVLVSIRNVERIEFRGDVALGQGDLRRAITDRFGATPPVGRAANVAEMLQAYYFDRGYLAAAIRPVVEEKGEQTILTFEIAAGTRASVRNVDISGDPGESQAAFLERIGAAPGTPYQRTRVQQRLTDYVDRLRRQGRYEAEGSHRITSIVEDGRAVDLAVTIDRGREIVVRFEGDPLPKDRLEELVPVRREGSIDEDIVEDSEARIVSYLNDQGYWKATVNTERREIDSRVEVVFTVTRGPQYRIEGAPQVSGNNSIPIAELQPALEPIRNGDIFRAAALDNASRAILGIYLQRGFAQAKVESAPNEAPSPRPGEGRIRPVILIEEGPRMTVGEVTFTGNTALDSATLAGQIRTTPGEPYFEPRIVQDRETILSAFLNEGFADATVQVTPTVVEGSQVNVAFTITEGAQSIVDHVLITGNVKTDPRVIEREVQLTPGEPLGLDDLFETRRRLAALGLFRRIRIREIPHGDSTRRDVLIEVEEAPSTTIGYGGGLEVGERRLAEGPTGEAEDRWEIAPRGFFEVGRRHLGGRNRSVNLYTRVSLRSDLQDGGSSFGFPEYRVVATYREPRAFFWNADVTVAGVVEQGVRSTFNFARKGVNVEVHHSLFGGSEFGMVPTRAASPQVLLSNRYTFATTRIFDQRLDPEEQLAIDRIFPRLRLSMFSSSLSRDSRDDAIDPSRGAFISIEGTSAARALGGEVGFLKTLVQAQGYQRLPGPRRIVLAARIAVGLADGYPRQERTIDPDGNEVVETIEDLPASERFFAGGDTTIRGFPLDSVGAPETISAAGFPRGGNGLILANAELRVPVWRGLGTALFIDSGNVFDRVSQIDLGELRGAVGFGLRYNTPIGPLRFDVGFKLDVRETDTGGRRSFHLSFGHAF